MSLLASLFDRRASPENPSFDINDPEAWDVFGASPSDSGIRINSHSALRYAPVWRAVNLLSGDVAKLPCLIYERRGEGKRRAIDHHLFSLLRHKPNAEMTAFHFYQITMKNALIGRGGFAYIFRRGDGRAEEIIPLGAHCTYPVRANGKLWYVTTFRQNGRETMRKLEPDDVLHIRGLTLDGIESYDMAMMAKESIGLGLAAEKFSTRFFRNNGVPGLVIEHPGKLSDQAKRNLKASWNQMQGGLENAHKAAIMEEGMKAHVLSHKARESQLLELRKHQIIDVANYFGVPPHMLGDTSRTSYNSLEQENQAYLDRGLDVWLVNWEQELRDKLLTEREKREDSHTIEFLRQALVRADLTTRANYYRVALGGRPWMKQNEVRSLENLNPVEGGDEILDPLNMGKPGGNPNDPQPPDPNQDGGDDDRSMLLAAQRAVIAEATARMLRRVGTHCRRAAKRPGEFDAWLDGMDDEHRATVREALSGPLRVQCMIDDRVDQLTDLTNRMADEVIQAVRVAAEHVHNTASRSEFAAEIDRAMTETEGGVDAVIDRIFTKE